MLKLLQHAVASVLGGVGVRGRLGFVVVCILRMRFLAVAAIGHERYDGRQRQGRLHAGPGQADPGQRSPGQDVHGPPPDAETANDVRDGHATHDEEQPDGFHRMVGVRVENGNNDESDGVIGHRQQKQEIHRRMQRSEHHPCHQPRQGDVGGGGDGPPVGHRREVVGATIDDPRQRKVHPDGAEDPAQGAGQRVDGPAQRVEHPARQRRLGDFLGGDPEEQAHEHAVDYEMKGHLMTEYRSMPTERIELDQPLVPVVVDVGGDQAQDSAQYQWQRKLLYEVGNPKYLGYRLGDLGLHLLLTRG